MKRYIALGMLILSILTLIGCSYRGNPFPRSDLTTESWMSNIDNSPNRWARGADRWFLTGDPNATEQTNITAPDSSAISTMMIRVPNFNHIRVEGPVQVQIYGTTDHNSVFVYGPNAQVREVSVDIRGNTLCIGVTKEAMKNRNMRCVIVRVGVANLNSLIHRGSGNVEGRQIRSTNLRIVSAGSGNIYLSGDMNVTCITHTGCGCVNVFGAITPVLDIDTTGSGEVNISGNVGIRSIKHRGTGDVNIIGGNTDGLKIYTDGSGKIGINGRVNIREIVAKERTCVYICSSMSNSINAYLHDNAKVGISGITQDLSVDARSTSRFMGRNLCTMNAYVRAHDRAHINVTASSKIYASATEAGSVYFFGTPDRLSQFVRDNGTVIPIWYDGMQTSCMMNTAPRYVRYKDSPPAPVQMQRAKTHPYPYRYRRYDRNMS